jgi:hypothetical protein
VACNISALATSTACPLKLVPDAATMSPWVQISFKLSGVNVTVGNRSSPQNNNTAVIKEFEMAVETTMDCRVTILDEEGSSFAGVIVDLLKNSINTTPVLFSVQMQFGWALNSCPSGTSSIPSKTYFGFCRSIDTNFTNGVFRFTLVIQHMLQIMSSEFRADTPIGTNQNEVSLTSAINQLLTNGNPSVGSVQFLTCNPNGTFASTVFANGNTEGPLGTWLPNSMDKMNAVLAWLSQNGATINKKAITPLANTLDSGGQIIFLEDRRPTCAETVSSSNCLGTYIVNGGCASNVLEFNPRINWHFAGMTAPGGGTGLGTPQANPNGGANPGREGCPTLLRAAIPNTGSTNSVSIDESNFNNNLEQAGQVAQLAQDVQQRAISIKVDPFSVDLVIVGDPTLIANPQNVYGKNVNIIFINPQYLSGQGGSCGSWLASPLTNPIFTNNSYIVRGLVHRIAEGKFTTTLRLYLTLPAIDINVGQPLGGAGSNGPVLTGN